MSPGSEKSCGACCCCCCCGGGGCTRWLLCREGAGIRPDASVAMPFPLPPSGPAKALSAGVCGSDGVFNRLVSWLPGLGGGTGGGGVGVYMIRRGVYAPEALSRQFLGQYVRVLAWRASQSRGWGTVVVVRERWAVGRWSLGA